MGNGAELLLALGLGGQLLLSVADPPYPPNVLQGGTAVFAVQFDAGRVKDVSSLSGEETFSTSGKQAIYQWKFAPEATGETLVVVCYRRPELFALSSTVQELNGSKAIAGLPSPKTVLEPGYPPNTNAQGSVVLRLEVAKNGSVVETETIKGLGTLTQESIQAAKGWIFTPARDQKGNAVDSSAYAVFVFRPPVLVPTRSNPR